MEIYYSEFNSLLSSMCIVKFPIIMCTPWEWSHENETCQGIKTGEINQWVASTSKYQVTYYTVSKNAAA
jgi:hypothetical protein